MISIIYPVCNVGNYLEKSLQSLLNQDFTDFEIIAVNDGSTDDSLSVIKKFASKDSRIKVYDQENQGVAATRYKALKNAKGKYVSFVDSDDVLPENALSLLYNSLINNDSDISEGNYCKVFPSGEISNYEFPSEKVVTAEQNIDLLLSRRVIYSLCAKLFKKSLFINAELKKFVYLEDFCLAVQAFARAKKISLVNQCVYNYIQRHDSAVHSHYGDRAVADHYFSRLWIVDYIKDNFQSYNNLAMLDGFLLQGYTYAVCYGGKKYFSDFDYKRCKLIFDEHKVMLPIGQRIVFQTIPFGILNKISIWLYQIRLKNAKR